MEIRSQNKEKAMPSSLGFNNLNHNHNRNRHQQPLLNLQDQSHMAARDLDPNISTPATCSMDSVPTTTRSVSRSSPPQPTNTSVNPPSSSVKYRECIRNYAARTGGYVVDGCGEFMPSGEEGTPEALKCAACECHRNFHRREDINDESRHYEPTSNYKKNNHQRPLSQLPNSIPPPTHHRQHPHGLSMATTTTATNLPSALVMMNFDGSGGTAAESSSEDLNMYQSNIQLQAAGQHSLSKKRFRTKFTHQQKERMMEFAQQLGWRIQKQDEQEVQQFCSQMGVKRKVFKVWMHNNKQATKKKQV